MSPIPKKRRLSHSPDAAEPPEPVTSNEAAEPTQKGEEEDDSLWLEFAEEYHDIVEGLPVEIHRNYRLLKELDDQMIQQENTLKSSLYEYLDSLSSDVPQDRQKQHQLLMRIAQETKAPIRSGEDKIALAITSYEWVDRHIRRLDADLAKYEDTIAVGLRAGTRPSGESEGVTGIAKAGTHPEQSDRKKEFASAQAVDNVRDPALQSYSRPVMGVDPSEPRYCYCNDVSHGEMVACDNPDCEKEWFHLQCAKLVVPPKGSWYCRDCEKIMARKIR